MKIIERDQLTPHAMPGRIIQKAVGKDGYSTSGKMTMGYAHYSEASGPMEPHHHAEEIVHVLAASHGVVRHGPEKDQLTHTTALHPGMTLHIPEREWHVFEFGPGGFVDILFFYGQVDQIRPEEMDA